MKKSLKVMLGLLTVTALIGLQACQEVELGNGSSVLTDYSPTLPVGNGVARAWISVNRNGVPSVGINLSAEALQNLPDEPKDYVLILPKNKGQNFYTHVLIDWNPHGHEPEGVYDLPHFDFHFYIVSNEARIAVPPLDPPNMDLAPADKYIPPFYIELPGMVPQMGAHWVDVTSPELNGSVFTNTFLWGSYNGEFTFWEPMITREYLLTHPDKTFPISQPATFQKNGWYPMDYKVSFSSDRDEYSVALINLTYHKGE